MSMGHAANDQTAAPRRTLSVRLRLMIMAVIFVLPLLVERIHNEQIDRNDRIAAAYRQALSLARQGAATQNEILVSLRGILQSVASARSTFKFPNADCDQFLAKIAKPIPWIQALSVADLQGRVICSSFPGALGLDISNRRHFIGALTTREFMLSDYLLGTRAKIPIVTGALPQIGDDGEVASVVLGVIDLSWFAQIANDFVAPSGNMLMIDGSGIVLAQYPNGEKFVGHNFKDQVLIQNMLNSSSGLVIEPGLDGVRRIYGFVQLPDTQARFAVGFDADTVLSRANYGMWTALGELGAMILLALLGIWFGGEKLLVSPIRKFAQAASKIGHGENKSRAAELPWAAEFVPLAVALDDMTDKLDARERELRDLNDQLHELAHTDALTGLANRRTFNSHLANAWKAAARLQQPVAVLMIDVDFFKKFNDHYGHVQGDACLRKIANAVSAGLRGEAEAIQTRQDMPPSFTRMVGLPRKPDFVARYGGEEFAVLLQGTDLGGAVEVGKRLRQAVEDMLMAHVGAPWGFVSISVGTAAIVPVDTMTPSGLVESADEALYEAKRRGRNQVVARPSLQLVEPGRAQAN
jgi:GGDEF domain-containing protein